MAQNSTRDPSASGKRPLDSAPSDEAADKAPKPADDSATASGSRPAWKIGEGRGGTSVKDALKKEETKSAVSSIKSKLSKPKVASSSLEDTRKAKMSTFSAGLTREQIEESQQRHKEKAKATGRAVPTYIAPRGSGINRD